MNKADIIKTYRSARFVPDRSWLKKMSDKVLLWTKHIFEKTYIYRATAILIFWLLFILTLLLN